MHGGPTKIDSKVVFRTGDTRRHVTSFPTPAMHASE